MADRDVTFDIIGRDKSGPAITSVERNLKRANNQVEKTKNAIGKIANQWGRGFAKMSGAANSWANSGDTAGKRFVRGLGSGIGTLSKIGSSIGGSLSKAVNAAGPYVQVAMVAVLAGAALTAAPAIAGAIVGGAGLGGIVGGVIIASRDVRVRSAFDSLKEEAGSQLGQAAQRFVPATLDAISEAKAAFRGMLPDLRKIFDTSSTWLAPLTRSLGRAAQLALSGIATAVSKAGPIIRVVGESLERIGAAVGRVFADLSDNGASMAAGVKAAFMVIEGAIILVGMALNALTETFEYFVNKIPGGKKWLDSFGESANGTKGKSYDLAGGLRAIGSGADSAANGITRLKEKQDELVNNNLSLREAQIAARNAISETTKAIEANGRAKGFNTAKGRENEAALNALATAFNREADAGDRSGVSANVASNAYARNRQALIKAAQAAGYTKKEAESLAAQLLRIPKNVNTDVNVNTSRAAAQVEWIQKKITNIRGKTVTVNVKVQSSGDHYMPGIGTQLKNASGSSFREMDGGISRTGGPTKVESVVNQSLYVSLDGQPFYGYTTRAISNAEKRQEFRNRVGRR